MELPIETNDQVGAGDEFYIEIFPSWDSFQRPTDVFVGFDDNIYVTEKNDNTVVVLDKTGTELDRLVIESFPGYNPLSVAQSLDNDLYLVNGSNLVLKYSEETGFTEFYTDEADTAVFISVAVDYNNYVFVTDHAASQILKIEQDGSSEAVIEKGPGRGATMAPLGIYASDNIYFTQEEANFLVQKADLFSYGPQSFQSSTIDTFAYQLPYDVVFDLEDERLFVSDSYARKVFVFDETGDYFNVVELDSVSVAEDKRALGVSFSDKVVYVADEFQGSVKRFQFIKDADVD